MPRPRLKLLMQPAFGDHQVANVATETEARTIGAAVHEPALAPGRSNEAVPVSTSVVRPVKWATRSCTDTRPFSACTT